MRVGGVITALLQDIEQQQRFVKRQRADRVLQQKAQAVGRQRPEVGDWRVIRLKKGRYPKVVDSLPLEPVERPNGNLPGVADERVGIDAPVQLGAACEPGHRIALDPDARDAEFLTLNQRRSCAAERVQHPLRRINPEGVKVVAHEVRRERENEAIPVVNGTIFGPEPVFFPSTAGTGSYGARGCHGRTRVRSVSPSLVHQRGVRLVSCGKAWQGRRRSAIAWVSNTR